MTDNSYLLAEETLPDNMEVKYINFIEDVVPKYLFLIANDTENMISYLYIKFITKNEEFFENDDNNDQLPIDIPKL
jgi:hypothetical protein